MNTIVVKQNVTRNMFGPQVADGWTPLLAAVEDGERRVFQITDWIGGTGDKPPVGLYLGPNGLVNTPAEATDIGVPTDYSSRDALAGARVPTPVQYVRTAGYAEPGDGGGALYKRVAFEPGHAGKVQSADSAWWEISERITVPQMFGAKGDGTSDDTATLQDWLDYLRGKRGFLPSGVYNVTGPLYVRKGTHITGEIVDEQWNSSSPPSGTGSLIGAVISATGPGVGARWTDIDGGVSDKSDFKPCVVFAGPGVVIEDVTIRNTGEDAWDAGIFNPGQIRTFIRRVNTIGKWAEGGYYLDATWSNANTTLTTLHPEIEASAGPIENAIEHCWLRGMWGLSVIGTTRDPEDPENSPWVWGEPGTSDLYVTNCRLECDRWFISSGVRENDGGCYRHDAATSSNPSGLAQGHFFNSCWFRTASKWLVKLDRSNRDTFTACYGEMNASMPNRPRFEVTSRTGMISLVNDAITAVSLYKDDVEVAPDIASASADAVTAMGMVLTRVNGRWSHPHLQLPPLGSGQATQIGTSHNDGGIEMVKAQADGTRSRIALFGEVVWRPDGVSPSLGNSGNRFALGYIDEVRLGDISAGPRLLSGTGSPEGVISAPPGSVFFRTDPSNFATAQYRKITGTGNTGWASA